MNSSIRRKLNLDVSSCADGDEEKHLGKPPPQDTIISSKRRRWEQLISSTPKLSNFWSPHFNEPPSKSKVYLKNIDYQKTLAPTTTITLDHRLTGLAILFAISIFVYKAISIIAVPQMDSATFSNVVLYSRTKFEDGMNWIDQNDVGSKLLPLLFGILFSVFSTMMVYLDSSVPGVNPPLPFSSKSTYRNFHQQKSISLQLNYMTAMASGVVVSALLYFKV